MKHEKSIFNSVVSISGIVILAKIIGFIKQMVMANSFGATIETDIISLSQGFINNIDYVLVQTLITAFVPTYLAVKAKNKDEADIFTTDTVIVFFSVTFVITVAIMLFSEFFTVFMAPSYSSDLRRELAKYTRLTAFIIIPVVQIAIFNAFLKANKIFAPGEFVSINQSIIYIVLIYALKDFWGIDTLVIALYVYAFANLIFLVFCSKKLWKIKRSIKPFKNENVLQLLKMMLPLIAGYSMIFINTQIDRIIVSGLGEGVITAMSYAAVLSNFVTTFLITICGILFTYMSQKISEKKYLEAVNLVTNASVKLVTVLIPINIITVVNANDIVNIAFGYGKFDVTAVKNSAFALCGYSFMFIPLVFRELFSRFQYSYGDSKRPMINSSIAIFFNIVLSIILSFYLGVFGVTFASSFSVVICAFLNVICSKKLNKNLSLHRLIQYIFLWALGVCACVAVSLAGKYFLSEALPAVRLGIITILTAVIYLPITYKILKPLLTRMLE